MIGEANRLAAKNPDNLFFVMKVVGGYIFEKPKPTAIEFVEQEPPF